MSEFVRDGDCAALAEPIAALVEEAFRLRYGSGTGEAALIAALRRDGDVVAELAALSSGAVVGHAMFSRLTVEPGTTAIAALAPVAAKVGQQGLGIGSALIREGHRLCAARGIGAVAVLGDPAYYGRFGYGEALARRLESPYDGPHFQALELVRGALDGGPFRITYARAFLE